MKKNVTLAIEKGLLAEAHSYARARNQSLNGLLRELLTKTVRRRVRTDWLEEFLNCCEEAEGDSGGRRWSRDELHER